MKNIHRYSCILLLCFLFSHAKANDSYTIPIDLSKNTPLVEAKVGKETVYLSFDSGTYTSLIVKNDILKNNSDIVRFTGKYKHSIDASGKKQSNPEFELQKIFLGSYQAEKILGHIYTPWGLSVSSDDGSTNGENQKNNKTKDGVFGLDLLKNKHLIIDYPNKKLIILPEDRLPEPYASLKWDPCKQHIDSNGVVMEGIFKGKRGRFLLDTGATGSFLKPSFLRSKKNIKNITDNFKTNKGIDLGKIKFHLYEFVEPQVDGVLGYDFFHDKKIHIEIAVRELPVCYISQNKSNFQQ